MDIDNIEKYIQSLNQQNEKYQYYEKIINFQNDYFIPAIRFDTALFLDFICTIYQPKSILEIGFGSGASALFINKNCHPKIFISLERDHNRYIRGQALLKEFSKSNNDIQLLNQDAFEFLNTNQTTFDFVFLDAVKRDYVQYLPCIKKILNPKAVFIADNILFNNKVINQNLEKKYQTGVKLLKDFNQQITNDQHLNTVFLNIGDGLSISTLK
ncbi:MAG: class I SAM-dependent methyltransferase [Spirochaetes bacterium]|nr:class I SAM-dependent methyltransferase [Spirochaetota bacterium]